MLDTERLLILAHVKMTEIYNGGSGISSALIRAVPTTPVISAHTARTRCMLGFKKIFLLGKKVLTDGNAYDATQSHKELD